MQISREERLSIQEQLVYWLFGHPVHNRSRDECTPDFNCCLDGEGMDIEERLRFVKAERGRDWATRDAMLLMSLSRMTQEADLTSFEVDFEMKESGAKVHVAGFTPDA